MLLFLAGAALIAAFAMISSLVQLITSNEMRGRVMSVYNVAFRGGMPFGNLASGWLIPMFSAPIVISANGILLISGRHLFSDGAAACGIVVMMMYTSFLLSAALAAAPENLEKLRDLEDRPALERSVGELSAAAEKAPSDADAQYRLALASSYLAEISLELRDKAGAERAAKTGISAAERAVALKPDNAEYFRVLGTLYGQVIPANVLLGISYGKKAEDAIAKAIALDRKSAQAYLARGIGNYYKPEMFGGGPEPAIQDLRRAIELSPKSAEAYLWLGLALRKTHHNAEAREAFTKSLELNPERVWTKQQLEKTPAQ